MPETSQREELYRTLFDSIDLGCCLIEMIFDEKGKPVDYRFLELNPSFERQSGMVAPLGKRMREFAPRHEEYWFEIYGEVATTGRPTRFVHQAKELGRWFDVYAYRLGGDESRKVALLFTDITERIRAEQSLRESEERFRNLFNSMEEGFCIVQMIFDESGKPVDLLFKVVNAAFERQTGLTGASGKRVLELVPEVEDYWFKAYEEVVLTGRPARFTREAKLIGRVFDIYATRYGPESARQVAVTFSDVTDRIRSEEKIKELNTRLDAKVRERTRELTAAVEELESFCYSVSHDLRTPLRGIEAFASLIQKELGTALTAPAHKHLERVRAAAARMSHIIDSLLNLARVNRGELTPEDVDLSALARDIAAELAKRRPHRAVEWILAPGLRARGDAKMLRLALHNLLENAWKFTESRERARIEVGRSARGGRDTFFVRDDGAGFDMSYYRKLFQPFERLHRADEYPGTGIGLATVHRIVKRHGGEVWAESAPGRGAVFYFTLPG